MRFTDNIVSIALYYSCTVVLFNPRKNSQAHVLNACRKTVTSLALAGDGKLLATGECGHMPNVRVWDISDPHNAVQIAEFPGHKYGINCVVSATCNNFSSRIFAKFLIFFTSYFSHFIRLGWNYILNGLCVIKKINFKI